MAPGLVLSLIAVGISIWSTYYTYSKDTAARIRSVRDDYWLRKAVLPTCVEPFLKDLPALAGRLDLNPSIGAERLQTEWAGLVADIAKHAENFSALGLLDQAANEVVQRRIEAMDDLVAEHLGALIGCARGIESSSSPQPDNKDAARRLREAGHAVLRAAMDAHVSLTEARRRLAD